ncbi:MAG: hypothetical protein OHK0048_17890 [Rhodoferax sp.]
MNISSVVAYLDPNQAEQADRALLSLPGVQTHATTADGRRILSIEAEDDTQASAVYQAIERLPGVWSVALVYQHSE